MERLGPGNSGFSPRPLDRSDAGFNGNLKNPDSGLHLLRFWRVKDGRLGAYGELSRSSCHGNIKVSGIKAAPIEYDCYVGFETLKKKRTPYGPTRKRSASTAVLFSHSNGCISERNSLVTLTQFESLDAGSHNGRPMLPNTSFLTNFH